MAELMVEASFGLAACFPFMSSSNANVTKAAFHLPLFATFVAQWSAELIKVC
jgi:hypothetical protein